MRQARQDEVTVAAAPDAVFQAALGVAQNAKNDQILAVHNEGRKLVFREKAMMSNPKFVMVFVEGQGGSATLHIAVGTDPRSSKALLDGKANEKALQAYVEKVQNAVNGTDPIATEPMSNHYLQKKNEVPWTDADQEPDIEVGGTFKAMYGL